MQNPDHDDGSPSVDSLKVTLGEDWATLIELSEVDLERHEDAVNAHSRSSMTIRGFAITAVAALVAATYASGNPLPACAGFLASLYLGVLDWGYTLLYAKTEQRIRVLNSLGRSYRRLAARPLRRSNDSIKELQGDLRAYSSQPAVPKELNLVDDLRTAWRNWLQKRRRGPAGEKGDPTGPGLGSFRWYLPLYAFLAAVALVSATTADGRGEERIVLCRPPGQIAVIAKGLKAEDCLGAKAERSRIP
jgi:hypothetical protein